MPFTFSHPAAILPLRTLSKHLTSLTGLVIGSMAPDFEYFLRLRGYGEIGHTWLGLIWFDLPLAIVCAFVFHRFVRDTLIDNLPGFVYKRFIGFKNFDWINYFRKNYFIVIVSVMIGGLSHVLWDGLTHKHGLFVKKNGWFDQAFIIAGYITPRYKMLQHSSSIVGGVVILYALLRMPVQTIQAKQESVFPYWISVSGIMLSVFAIRMFFVAVNEQWSFNIMIVTLVAGWLIGLLFTPWLLTKLKRFL